jgi:ABC-type phosphate transport system substrate-binding protein
MKSSTAAALALSLLLGAGDARAAEPFKVIVNSRLGGRAISRATLAEIFLGRAERWSDGHVVVPIDLSTTAAVRGAFSQDVLGMSVLAVRQYWTRTIASGHVPPMTRATDEQIVAFVAGRPGGVGYVSAETVLPETVHAVELQ